MISYMKGVVAFKDLYGIVLEVNGIGYEISMSSNAVSQISAGQVVEVFTYLQVKEDGLSLFGFSDANERELFTRLISVSGIGPKMGIAALSTMSVPELSSAIASGDITKVSSVPGVGKKTAQRIVLELQGIFQADGAVQEEEHPAVGNAAVDEATAALQSMGFSSAEIATALKGCQTDDVSAAIRYALKNLGGK